MNLFKKIRNGFNWLFGGGTKAKSNIIDLTQSMTMDEAKTLCDIGHKVRFKGWPEGEYVRGSAGLYWKRSGDTLSPYKWQVSGPDSMGSWEIVL